MTYTTNEDYLKSFQDKYQSFVQENALPSKNEDKVLIKYFAIVEKIFEKPISRIPSDKHYIWTRSHIRSYINGKTAFVWLLRVYKLKDPYWAEPTPYAIRYANLKEKVSIEDKKPVLSDEVFLDLINNL